MSEAEIATATRFFQRRHVYEHNGGEVDEKYLRDSGDTSVRLKQSIRETQAGVHEFGNLALRMARNIHRGFHDIYEPLKGPIDQHEEQKTRLAEHERRANARQSMPLPQTAKHTLKGQ